MSYTEADVSAARAAMDKYRVVLDGEVAAACGGWSLIRDDMIRVTGASLRQLAEVPLGRKTVTAIVEAGLRIAGLREARPGANPDLSACHMLRSESTIDRRMSDPTGDANERGAYGFLRTDPGQSVDDPQWV